MRIWSSTTIARSTVKPLVTATSVFGRMPAATTTRSQAISVVVPQPDAADLVRSPDRGRPGSGEDADAELGHAAAQHLAALATELGVHQVLARVHHVDGEAVALQAAGRLQAEQATTDHHRLVVVVVGGVADHGPGVVDGAEGEDPGQQAARR